MSISDDVAVADMIDRFAGPLSPVDRPAFRQAAEDALTRLPCEGEGAVYRVLVAVWCRDVTRPHASQWKAPTAIMFQPMS
jgi:hypothetical protein